MKVMKVMNKPAEEEEEEEPDLADTIRGAAVHDEGATRSLMKVWGGAETAMRTSEPLDGNIYKYFAFRAFMEKKDTDDAETLFTPPKDTFDRAMIIIGLLFIMIIQIIAPIALLSSNVVYLIDHSFNPFTTPWGSDPEINKCWSYFPSQWLVVFLSQAFLFCFILNAYKGCCSDKEQMQDVFQLALLLEDSGQSVCKCVLFFDAFINSSAAVLLSLSMFSVLFKEADAQGVIMDSLGLAFVLSLDDVASDLGFLGDVWNSSRVGRFYACLAQYNENTKGDDEDADSDDEQMDFAAASKKLNRIPMFFYSTAQCFLMIMLPFALISPFCLMHSAEIDPSLKKLMDGELFAQMAEKMKNSTNLTDALSSE